MSESGGSTAICRYPQPNILTTPGTTSMPRSTRISNPPADARSCRPASPTRSRRGVRGSCCPAQGWLKVLLVNTDPSRTYDVERGDRIEQLVLLNVQMIEWVEVDDLGATERNTFGFGSTGS